MIVRHAVNGFGADDAVPSQNSVLRAVFVGVLIWSVTRVLDRIFLKEKA